MNQFDAIKPSRGKVAASSIFALVLGLLQPIALMFQVMMPMPGICIAVVASVIMYAGAGLIPVVLYTGAASISSVVFFGVFPALIFLLLWIVPAFVIIRGMRRKQPFFRQLLSGIAVSVVVTALAVAALALIFGKDMIAKAIDQLRMTFAGQQDLFWEALSPVFRTSEGTLSKEQFIEAYYQMFNMLQVYYEYYLLANQLSGAVISAMLGVLWGNWLLARRGEATAESFRGLSEWFLSSNTTFGILLTIAASRLLTMTSLAGAETAWIVVSTMGALAFAVQCLAAMDRRMKSNGSSVGRRITLLALLVIFGSMMGPVFFGMDMMNVLAVFGCASALLGRKGAAKPLIQKIKNNMDGEDR